MANDMRFTADQQRAIETRGQNILVAAAAGSGKTRVLVERIIAQVRSGELSLDRVLVLTFTKAAAAEMRERIETALNAEIDRIAEERAATSDADEEIAALERQRILLTGADISTFHSFCQRILQTYIEATQIPPNYRLASEQEILLLTNDVFERLLEEKYSAAAAQGDAEGFLAFADAYVGDKGGDERLQKAVLALYKFALSQPSPETWLAAQGSEPDDTPYWERAGFSLLVDELRTALRKICADYRRALALLSEGDDAFRAAAEKTRDAVLKHLGIYEALAGEVEAFAHAQNTAAWTKFVSAAAAAKKERGAIPRKDLDAYAPEIAAEFNRLTKTVFAAWDKLLKRLPETAEDLCAAENRANADIRRFAQLTIEFHAAMQREKIARGILYFSDLEHEALHLLCAHPEQLQADPTMVDPTDIAVELQGHFDAIMVDEYQDTNGLQEGILRQIARGDNRFIVGDVKQSIYRFRLADPVLFQQTYRAYRSGAAEGTLVTMSENFRSRAEVLEPINYIFSQIMTETAVDIAYDEKARLNPGRKFDALPGGKSLAAPMELNLLRVDYTDRADEEEKEEGEEESGEELGKFEVEAHFIARRIAELISEKYIVHDGGGGHPLTYSDIVILLRAAKGRAGVLIDALRDAGIPAYADEPGGYFESGEIRMMLALLAALDNARQDTALAAVLASPMIGLRMEELAELRAHTPRGSIYDMLTADGGDELPAELMTRARHALERIRAWRRYALVHSVPELLWMLYRDTGYYDYVGTLPGGVLRQANLRMLIDRASEFERTNERGLFRFLRYIDALRSRSTDLSAARTLGESENVVRIMTIHKSKGLEFPVVFLSNIGGSFNEKDTGGDLLYHAREGIGLRLFENTEAGRQRYDTLSLRRVKDVIARETKAEEMRILYVAMTRAQEKLILTGTLNVTRSGKDKLEQLHEKCLTYAQETGAVLPDASILGGKSYLDWIALALMRHPDGAQLFDADAEIAPYLPVSPAARFDVHLLDEDARAARRRAADEDDPILAAVRADDPLPEGGRAEEVARILDWHYDARGTEHIHAKTSVTELKRRRAELIEEMPPPFAPALGDAGAETAEAWETPRFLRSDACAYLTPMERGIAMHTFMQQLDLTDAADIDAIVRQVNTLLEKGILTEAERESIRIEHVWKFAASRLGRRMRAAKAVYRELPFGRLLPAQKYYAEAQDAEDKIFLQGIIDVLFEEDDGGYVLLDYKTDRKISAAAARARYQFQIDLYGEAVETILGRPVKERWLFLLDTGQEVKMWDAGK